MHTFYHRVNTIVTKSHEIPLLSRTVLHGIPFPFLPPPDSQLRLVSCHLVQHSGLGKNSTMEFVPVLQKKLEWPIFRGLNVSSLLSWTFHYQKLAVKGFWEVVWVIIQSKRLCLSRLLIYAIVCTSLPLKLVGKVRVSMFPVYCDECFSTTYLPPEGCAS